MRLKLFFMGLSIFLWVVMQGCGGSSGTATSNEKGGGTLTKGYVIDAPVSGLGYRCGDITGITDDRGMFECREFPVTFSIGNLILGSVSKLPLDKKVYPQDLIGKSRSNFSDPKVVKVTQFLQSLDDDGDISKIIRITPETAAKFTKKEDLSKLGDADLRTLVEDAGKTYVAPETAITHLKTNAEKVLSFMVSPRSATISKNKTVVFSVTAKFANGTSRDVTSQSIFSSSDPSVAAVHGNQVTGQKPGSASIKVAYGQLSKHIILTVKAPELKSLKILALKTKLAAGTETTLQAEGHYDDRSTQDLSKEVTWKSSAPAIATVDATGKVKALKPGTVTITATKGFISSRTILTVEKAELTGIMFSQDTVSIAKGLTATLDLLGIYGNGQKQPLKTGVRYTSDKPTTVTVDIAGKVTALQEGIATVTAKSGVFTATAKITVTAPVLKSIVVEPQSVMLAKGESKQFVVKGTYSDKTVKNITDRVAWATSDTVVAKVDTNGSVKALQEGSAKITAAVGALSSSATVNVTKAQLTSVKITPLQSSKFPKGTTQQLKATAGYSDGVSKDVTADVTWSVDNDAVSVDQKGFMTAKKIGKAVVTATKDGKSDKIAVEVTEAKLVSLSIATVPDIEKGKTAQLTVTGTYTGQTKKDISSKVLWSSSNTTIATVNSKGLLTALKAGTVKITAKSGTITAEKEVIVLPPVLTAITLSPEGDVNLVINHSDQLTATGSYTDGSTKDISIDVSWTSSSDLVTVSNDGQVTGYGIGTATVTATLGGKSASRNVNVTDIHYTEVSGQIRENTTWTLDKSPYKLTGTIQIAKDTTLTIEPGVRVYGNGNTIEVFGIFNISGNSKSKVFLKNMSISSKPALININYAHLRYVNIYADYYTKGLNIKNSIIENLNNKYRNLINTPTQECIIEKNIFINTYINLETTYSGSEKMIFRNNYCYQGFKISYNGLLTVLEFQHNNFFTNIKDNILKVVDGDSEINAINNYWGTIDETKISSMIWDNYDDLALGEIVFKPYLTEPDPDTPTYDPSEDTNDAIVSQFNVSKSGSSTVIVNGVLQQNSKISFFLQSNADKSYRVTKFSAKDSNGRHLGETTDPSVLNNNYIYPDKSIGITLTIGYGGAVLPVTGIFYLEEIETGKEFTVSGTYNHDL